MITQEQLKEYVHYDPETGIFTRGEARHFGRTMRNGYIRARISGNDFYAHRLAWLYQYGQWPNGHIDHINGVRKDNRIQNLRVVSPSENSRNAKRRRNSATRITGVTLMESGKLKAAICIAYKNIYLGCFDTIFDAACARKSAELLHGFHANHGRAPS
jgi:hypothetical protein